jgi:hypothetical protein
MDFWATLGISQQGGLLAVGGGLLAALAVAATMLFRRSRSARESGRGLHHRGGS